MASSTVGPTAAVSRNGTTPRVAAQPIEQGFDRRNELKQTIPMDGDESFQSF